MAAEAQATLPSSPVPRLPLGYFACRKRILLLQRFQNLVRHREHTGTNLHFVPPLDKLLPRNTKPEHRQSVLDREINKLTVPVIQLLFEACVQTRFIQKRAKQRLPFSLDNKEPEVETISYDVIHQYFYADNMKVSAYDSFKAVIHVTDQGIGTYELRKKTAFWEIFNPALWIAHLIRLPMWILSRAGFAPSQKFYESFIKTLMLIILAFGAVRLGAFTWKDLTPHLLKWLGI